MFNRKQLQARIDRLIEQRDEACRERDAAVWFTGRLAQQDPDAPGPNWEAAAKQIAADRAKADQATKWQIAKADDINSGWIELCAAGNRRVIRLARGAARYRKTISEQAATIAAQAERLAKYEGGGRALMPPPRTGADAVAQLLEAKKQLALRDEQIRKLDGQIQKLETANAAGDWQVQTRWGAMPGGPLQEAS
jgi:hypothetical protein